MVSREKIEALWYSRHSNDELQELLGVTEYQLWMAKRVYGLPRRPSVPPDDPDEATIAERCLEVQANWSPEERARRFVGGRGGQVTMPSYLFTPTGLFVEAGPHL